MKLKDITNKRHFLKNIHNYHFKYLDKHNFCFFYIKYLVKIILAFLIVNLKRKKLNSH